MSVLLMGQVQTPEWLEIDKMLLQFRKSKVIARRKFAYFVEQRKELDDYFNYTIRVLVRLLQKADLTPRRLLTQRQFQ